MERTLVLILSHNSRGWLRECLASLDLARARVAGSFDVLVVDNASMDGSVAHVRSLWPWAEVLETGGNLGFAGGNNAGLRVALERGYPWVYLLNPDTEVEPDFLEQGLAVATADETVGAVQSKLLLHPERHLINSAGNCLQFLGVGFAAGCRTPDRTLEPTELAYPSGAGVLLRATALRAVGLFDEEFFCYQEDADLGWRIRLAGLRVLFAPGSVVYHKWRFSRNPGKLYLLERNRYRMIFKNYRLATLALLAPALVVWQLGMLGHALLGGWFREHLSVIGHFLRPATWCSVLAARRQVQAHRSVSDREIVRLFTGRVEFADLNHPLLTWVANPFFAALWAVLRGLIRW